MRATVRGGPGEVRITEVPDASVSQPTDAVVRVVMAAVCGTDLWGYRGEGHVPPGPRAGHEFLGVIEDFGRDVRRLRRGQLVLAPFMWADGHCPQCLDGLPTSCRNGGMWGGEHDGGQGEAVRVPFADATLVPIPMDETDERLPTVLTLADVMATGTYSVRKAGVRPGSTVVVIGDGAVGLCAVLAAVAAGADSIVLASRHQARAAIGKGFGATHILAEQDVDLCAEVQEITGGRGARSVLDCVGTQSAVDTAVGLVADGGTVVLAGAPHASIPSTEGIFLRNLTVTGGLTPSRVLIPGLLERVLSGQLDNSQVFDLKVGLDDVPHAYWSMADRTAVKALITL